MLNKLGYIELYISKTRIYRSFSEVPLPFKSMLITFHISNSSKSLESSQFRDQHTDRNQLTLLSFLTHIYLYHSYIEHIVSSIAIPSYLKRTMIALFLTASSISRKQTSYKDRNVIKETNDWIIFHSIETKIHPSADWLLLPVMLIPFTSSSIMNNIMLNNKLRSLHDFCM